MHRSNTVAPRVATTVVAVLGALLMAGTTVSAAGPMLMLSPASGPSGTHFTATFTDNNTNDCQPSGPPPTVSFTWDNTTTLGTAMLNITPTPTGATCTASLNTAAHGSSGPHNVVAEYTIGGTPVRASATFTIPATATPTPRPTAAPTSRPTGSTRQTPTPVATPPAGSGTSSGCPDPSTLPVPTVAPVTTVVEINAAPITGAETTSPYAGEIPFSVLSFTGTPLTSITSSTTVLGPATGTRRMDATSPTLELNVADGHMFPCIEVEVVDVTRWWNFVFSHDLFTSYTVSGPSGSDEQPTDALTWSFVQARFVYGCIGGTCTGGSGIASLSATPPNTTGSEGEGRTPPGGNLVPWLAAGLGGGLILGAILGWLVRGRPPGLSLGRGQIAINQGAVIRGSGTASTVPKPSNQGAGKYDQGAGKYDQGAAKYDQGAAKYNQGAAKYDQGTAKYDQGQEL